MTALDRHPIAANVRFRVEPRDVPPQKAARRLHLTESDFVAKLPALLDRGFPPPDPTTGMFDLKAIDDWMDKRHTLTTPNRVRNAKEVVRDRLARL